MLGLLPFPQHLVQYFAGSTLSTGTCRSEWKMEKAPPFFFVYTYTKLEVWSDVSTDTMPTWYHWQHTICLLGVATLFLMKFSWLLKSRPYCPKKTLNTVCDGNYSGLGISVPFINHAHRLGMYQSIVQFKSLSPNHTRREFVLYQRNVGPLFSSLQKQLNCLDLPLRLLHSQCSPGSWHLHSMKTTRRT